MAHRPSDNPKTDRQVYDEPSLSKNTREKNINRGHSKYVCHLQ